MSVSVMNTNRISRHVLHGGIEILAGASAGAMVLNSYPAGALFSASRYIVSVLASKLCVQEFHINDPRSSEVAQLVAGIVVYALSIFAGFVAFAAMGVPLTFEAALSFAMGVVLRKIVIKIFLRCCCLTSLSQPFGAPPAYA
jgi:hypothetical protein